MSYANLAGIATFPGRVVVGEERISAAVDEAGIGNRESGIELMADGRWLKADESRSTRKLVSRLRIPRQDNASLVFSDVRRGATLLLSPLPQTDKLGAGSRRLVLGR